MTQELIEQLAREHACKILGEQINTNGDAALSIMTDYTDGFNKATEIWIERINIMMNHIQKNPDKYLIPVWLSDEKQGVDTIPDKWEELRVKTTIYI